MTAPWTSRTGTLPYGLRAKNSGGLCSFARRLKWMGSQAICFSESAIRTFDSKVTSANGIFSTSASPTLGTAGKKASHPGGRLLEKLVSSDREYGKSIKFP